MSIVGFTSTFNTPTVTGDSSTTAPGFKPKSLIFFNPRQNTTGIGAGTAHAYVGFAGSFDGSTYATDNVVAGYNSAAAAALADVVRLMKTDACLAIYDNGATTITNLESLTSMDATGFTLNTSSTIAGSFRAPYLALGGSDISKTKSGSFSANTSTGNQAITGLGFQPDVVMFITNLQTASAVTNASSSFSFGAATGSTARWASSVAAEHNNTTMNNRRSFFTDKCIVVPATTTDTVAHAADFVSFDSDGFTINWTTAPGAAYIVGYLAVKGGQWKVGTDSQKTSTGTQATTGIGFQPKGILFASGGHDTAGSVTPSARITIGATDGTNQRYFWMGDKDGVGTSVTGQAYNTTACIVLADETTPSVVAQGEYSSFDSDGFTINWTTADATARIFGYVAFGDNAGGGGGGGANPRTNLSLLGAG